MKILVLSDLHTEYATFLVDPNILQQADVVVLAGDIGSGINGECIYWARQTFGDLPIVFVPGNHEYYTRDPEMTMSVINQHMKDAALETGVHLLRHHTATNTCIIDGVRFIGDTLWTDYALLGKDKVGASMAIAQRVSADYKRIRMTPDLEDGTSGSGLLTPRRSTILHRNAVQWLETELTVAAPNNKFNQTVVVTHMFPSMRSCAAPYKKNLVSAAFGSNLDRLLNLKGDSKGTMGATLWVHGHTHTSMSYAIDNAHTRKGSTRVVCNPRGYPRGLVPGAFENPVFNPNLIIQI
jgi:Icc-related predicted phosphoesterase